MTSFVVRFKHRVVLLLFACLVMFGISTAIAAQPVQNLSASQTVKGEVLIISEDLFVVKNKEGQGLALSLVESTKVDTGVRVGDKVEATVTTDGTAVSIKKSQ